jgi:hypothetical protein
MPPSSHAWAQAVVGCGRPHSRLKNFRHFALFIRLFNPIGFPTALIFRIPVLQFLTRSCVLSEVAYRLGSIKRRAASRCAGRLSAGFVTVAITHLQTFSKQFLNGLRHVDFLASCETSGTTRQNDERLCNEANKMYKTKFLQSTFLFSLSFITTASC